MKKIINNPFIILLLFLIIGSIAVFILYQIKSLTPDVSIRIIGTALSLVGCLIGINSIVTKRYRFRIANESRYLRGIKAQIVGIIITAISLSIFGGSTIHSLQPIIFSPIVLSVIGIVAIVTGSFALWKAK